MWEFKGEQIMKTATYYALDQTRKDERKSISITRAWVRVVNGMSQFMIEIDGKWREILPYTNVANGDVSYEISAEDIAKSQPLGWLYKEGG